MIFGVSDPVLATIIFAAFFVVLALLATLRIVLRKPGRHWYRIRVGVFIERDDDLPGPDDTPDDPTRRRGE